MTGHDASGKSIVLSDGNPPHSENYGDSSLIEIWRTTSSPAPIASGEPHDPTDVPLTLAQTGGTVLRLVDYPPATQGGKRSPVHRTGTIDYCILL